MNFMYIQRLCKDPRCTGPIASVADLSEDCMGNAMFEMDTLPKAFGRMVMAENALSEISVRLNDRDMTLFVVADANLTAEAIQQNFQAWINREMRSAESTYLDLFANPDRLPSWLSYMKLVAWWAIDFEGPGFFWSLDRNVSALWLANLEVKRAEVAKLQQNIRAADTYQPV